MTLQRRTPLRAKPRGKGNRGELAVRDMLRAEGWTGTTRNWQSGGQGGGDLINGPAGVHLEVKYCRECKMEDWLRQAEGEARPTDIPMVVLRPPARGAEWWCVLPWDEWVALERLAEGETYTMVVPPSKRWRVWHWLADLEEQAFRDVGWTGMVVAVFSRPGGVEYACVPARTVFPLLRLRECA